MILVIGGYAQGKLSYVRDRFKISEKDIIDLDLVTDDSTCDILMGDYIYDRQVVLYNINSYIRRCLDRDQDYDYKALINRIIKNFPYAVIITDEVGCGIVPMERNERYAREVIGRAQCMLADAADEVIRVVCGISNKIK